MTLMIACVSPADYNIEETLSTLRYADRAKKIKNKPIKNQDSHEAEITRLKELIQSLRMAVLSNQDSNGNPGAAGVTGCGEECKKTKKEKEEEINSLSIKLSKLVNVLNSLNNQNIIEEAFCNELIEKFEKLRELFLKTCRAEFAVPETKIFDEIAEQMKMVDEMVVDFKKQLGEDEDFKFDENSDAITNQKRIEFNSLQYESILKIKSLEREMKIKQELLNRKNQNTPFLNDEADKTMTEYQTTIKGLEKELEELRSAGSNANRRDHNATKINMDRKHRLEKVEKDLEDMRKKCVNLEKTKKLAEQDRKRIDDLRKEILDMKTARIQLIRQQRSDSERFKKWIASRDKEINTLKEKGKKAQNEMKRMERMHEKQQTVLKRKVEEAKAVNKRLQDAMDRGKKVQAMRNTFKPTAEKQDVIQTYIDHELDILISTVDAKIAMQALMNDRGLLNERLMNLKSTVNKSEELEQEIKQLEEDLEMRNSQITDLRQKVMQTDLEDRMMKSIPENFSSASEKNIAMSYIIRALLDSREDFTLAKTKGEDLKAAFEASEERVEQLSEEIRKERENFEKEKSAMENDFETKLSFWCKHNAASGDLNASKTHEDEKAPIFVSMSNQLCAALDKTNELQQRIKDLELQLSHAGKHKTERTKPKKTEKLNETYEKSSSDLSEIDSDDSADFTINDSFADPEWRKTPAHKRKHSRPTQSLMKDSMTKMLVNISESSDTSGTKRTSSGAVKCSCKGSCATKLCSCKKLSAFCSDNCRCSDACVNIAESFKESEDDVKDEKENPSASPQRKNSK